MMVGFDDDGGQWTFDDMVKSDNNDGGCQGMNVVNVGDTMGDEKYETNEQMNVQSVSCAAHLTPSSG